MPSRTEGLRGKPNANQAKSKLSGFPMTRYAGHCRAIPCGRARASIVHLSRRGSYAQARETYGGSCAKSVATTTPIIGAATIAIHSLVPRRRQLPCKRGIPHPMVVPIAPPTNTSL